MATSAEVFAAIKSGDRSALEVLLRTSRELARSRDEAGVSALLSVMYHRHRDLAELLRGHLDALDVFEAAAFGDAPRLDELLRADATQARAFSPDGFTALHLAVFFGQPDCARILVEKGAEVNAVARNAMKVQPLHSAAANGHHGIMALLLEHGADVNARQQLGFTPLMARALTGDIEGARLLMAHGADPSLTADDGKSAPDLAREKGHAGAFAAMLRSGTGQ